MARAGDVLFGTMTGGARHAVVFLFILAVLIGAMSIMFTVRTVHRPERQFCAILADPATAAQARDFAALARDFSCRNH